MKTQRVVIPEVVYSPSRDRYNKSNKRKQYSHSNAKTAAMLTAAMLALAANAKADISINKSEEPKPLLIENISNEKNEDTNEINNDKFILYMMGTLAVMSLGAFAAERFLNAQCDRDLYKYGWTPEEVHKMADELWADGIRFTPSGIKIKNDKLKENKLKRS